MQYALHRGSIAEGPTKDPYAQATRESIPSRALSLPKGSREAAYRRMRLAQAQSGHDLRSILNAARFDTACGLLSMLVVVEPAIGHRLACPPPVIPLVIPLP